MTSSGDLLDLGAFLVMASYAVTWAVTQAAMAAVSALLLFRNDRRRSQRARALIREVDLPSVSLIVPAYNEGLTIADTVHALLALDYADYEIVVVNDGSPDDTLDVLRRTFGLVEAPVAFALPLQTSPLRGIFRSVDVPRLVVIDKDNGGAKADASNAGINAASGDLVVVIDADTVLQPNALSLTVLPFLENPDTVAVGANVGIVNGCRIENGRVVDVALPRSWLARFQVLEYMRAFLVFRMACTWWNAVPILSGAYGLFRRDTLIAVNGFDRTAIGEDFDLTLRIHQHYRERGLPYHVGFTPVPICWTQAPEDRMSLKSQRWRWRRGLLQTLWRRRHMVGNPRFGAIGLFSLPYMAVYEGLAPLLEAGSYVAGVILLLNGVLTWRHFELALAAAIVYGMAVSLAAVVLSDLSTKSYMRRSDTAILFATTALENLGYRQFNLWASCVGTIQAITGRRGWGTMKRQAF